jgi:hypothetical protein
LWARRVHARLSTTTPIGATWGFLSRIRQRGISRGGNNRYGTAPLLED